MAKFKASKRFRAIKEGVTHEADTEFDMTLERMKELQDNIKKNFPKSKIEFTRLDVDDKETKGSK